ncbi:MAG: hypothetical protein WBL63_10840 [Candidatus Acidiferrum sp.]
MKYVLIVVAAVAGLMATLVFLIMFTHIADKHERAGHFDIYTNPKVPDSSVQSALYYKRHLLSERLGGYSVDPNNPDRISFWSDDVFHGEGRCGTFLYDGRSKQLKQVRRWPVSVEWSLDSRFMLLDPPHPTILDLATGREVDLADAISREDGNRVELLALQLSPDGERLAATVGVSPGKHPWDQDLVEITVAFLGVRYIATIPGSQYPAWTEKDIQWSAGRLQLTAFSTAERPIMVKTSEGLGWIAAAPMAAPSPVNQDRSCTPVEPKSR